MQCQRKNAMLGKPGRITSRSLVTTSRAKKLDEADTLNSSALTHRAICILPMVLTRMQKKKESSHISTQKREPKLKDASKEKEKLKFNSVNKSVARMKRIREHPIEETPTELSVNVLRPSSARFAEQ